MGIVLSDTSLSQSSIFHAKNTMYKDKAGNHQGSTLCTSRVGSVRISHPRGRLSLQRILKCIRTSYIIGYIIGNSTKVLKTCLNSFS